MKIGRYLSLIVLIVIIGFSNSVGAEKIAENLVVINGPPLLMVDPALSNDFYDMTGVYNLYSPVLYSTPEGIIRPHLALDWKAVDDKIDHWRITLRQGVKFHDGSELTSEDVVFSANRFITIGKGFSSLFGKMRTVAIDKYTVDFFLEKPSVVFLEMLPVFFILNKKLVLEHIQAGDYGEFGDYGQNWLATHDAGSGPYIMVSHEIGQFMDATRFKEYFLGWENWGPDTVPIEKIHFIMETEVSTLMLLLKKGQLQMNTEGGFGRQQLEEIKNTKGIRITQVIPRVWSLWMNTKLPPTDDVHFRRAILYAYDYKSILKMYGPEGAKETGIYLSELPGYIKIPPQPRQQNLEKAKEELALSKYNTKGVKLSLHYRGGLEAQKEVCLQLQADLSKIGVKAEISSPTWPKFSAECGTPETTPNLSLFSFPLTYPSIDSFIYFMYHPDNVGGIYAAHWYKDEELGKLIDQSQKTLDFEKRLEIYQQIQEKIASKALCLYPYEIPISAEIQDYLTGPKEVFAMPGPNFNIRNWQVNLEEKTEREK